MTKQEIFKHKFKFRNTHNLKFVLFYNDTKGFAKDDEYTNALQALKAWYNKSRKHSAPFISVYTQHRSYHGSTGISFDGQHIDRNNSSQVIREYQAFLDKVKDHVKYLEINYPERL